MAKSIFERKEKKYVLTREQADALISALSEHMEPDAYPESHITSIYYDTASHDVIERSLEKPVYKEKLRVRDYGTGSVFVELKKKYKGIVYKRRIEVSHECARAWLDGDMGYIEARAAFPTASQEGVEPSYSEIQISSEVDAFRSRYSQDLVPSMGIVAHRLSYKGKGTDSETRLTLDVEILYNDAMSGQGAYEKLTDKVVMEVKVPGAYPMWLTKTLTSLGLFPSSFSKYGNAYKLVYLEGSTAREAKVASHGKVVRFVREEQRPAAYSPILDRKAISYA